MKVCKPGSSRKLTPHGAILSNRGWKLGDKCFPLPSLGQMMLRYIPPSNVEPYLSIVVTPLCWLFFLLCCTFLVPHFQNKTLHFPNNHLHSSPPLGLHFLGEPGLPMIKLFGPVFFWWEHFKLPILLFFSHAYITIRASISALVSLSKWYFLGIYPLP